MKPNYKIVPMRDVSDSYRVKKDRLFNLPIRLLICGKSDLSGKTTLVSNLLCMYYNKDFNPEDIYIISPSATSDEKWKMVIEFLEIPPSNVFPDYDEGAMKVLYEYLKDEYNNSVDKKEKPTHKLIIFDDLGSSDELSKKCNKTVNKIANNGRHYLISCIMLNQYYVQCNPNFRANVSGVILFWCTPKQAETIYYDHGAGMSKKDFLKKFYKATKEDHDFFTVNYSNKPDERYMHNFDDFIIL